MHPGPELAHSPNLLRLNGDPQLGYGRAERRQPSGAGCTGARSSRAGAFQLARTGAGSASSAPLDLAAATAVRVATTAAISSAVASPRTMRRNGSVMGGDINYGTYRRRCRTRGAPAPRTRRGATRGPPG